MKRADIAMACFKGSTAQFGKSIRPKILPHTKVIKGREYCMYFPFYNCTDGAKDWAKAADTIVR